MSRQDSVDQEIIKLVGQLQNRDATEREKAVAALGEFASDAPGREKIVAIPGALERFVKLLQDDITAVRKEAADVLWKLAINADNKVKIVAIRGALENLLRLLQDSDADVRNEAVCVLKMLAGYVDNQIKIAAVPGALESLVRLLRDPAEYVRSNTAGVLVNLVRNNVANKVKIAVTPEALESLVGLLQDPSSFARQNAAEALWILSNHADNKVKIIAVRGSLEGLVGLLQDSDRDIRQCASGALGNLAINTEIVAKIERIKAGGAGPLVAAPSPISDPTPPIASASTAGSATSGSFSLTRYEDIQFGPKIAEGGFGVVFRGKWSYTEVAIKQLKIARLSDKALLEFRSEAELHGSLRHTNVVQLYAVCLEAAKYCMVMELMSGGSLFNLLHNGRELPWSLRLSIAKDIAVGLNYLHGRGILHRDLKSLNVLLDDRMRAKLSDFGLSTLKAESSSTTAGGSGKSAVGTMQWMAPELFKRGTKKSELSDIYALGMTLWELAAREIPFKEGAGNEAVIMGWIKSGEQEKIPADTPRHFADLISRCWVQRAEVRPLTPAIISQLDAGFAADTSAYTGSGESGYKMFSG